jgi:hypothetical protein
MERQRPRELKEKSEEKLEDLRKELAELREKKRQKELMEKKAAEIVAIVQEKESSQVKEEYIKEPEIEKDLEVKSIESLEKRLNELDKVLVKHSTEVDEQTYEENAEFIDAELQALEQEISTEKVSIEKELSPYEYILEDYPWLEEKRTEYMYSIPDKKKSKGDFDSWREEWAKVLFDFAKYAILHILYVRKLNTEKPFSKFTNREDSIKEIAEQLIDNKLARWLSKKKDQLRVYWKTLEGWADEIFEWAYDFGKLEPILIYEIREANEEFSNLPKEDIEAIFKILAKEDKGSIIKSNDGTIALKIKID